MNLVKESPWILINPRRPKIRKVEANRPVRCLASFSDPAHKRIEHIAAAKALSAVIAESVLIEVHLQILRADAVIDAPNAVFR